MTGIKQWQSVHCDHAVAGGMQTTGCTERYGCITNPVYLLSIPLSTHKLLDKQDQISVYHRKSIYCGSIKQSQLLTKQSFIVKSSKIKFSGDTPS
jgi:hypothetical protein